MKMNERIWKLVMVELNELPVYEADPRYPEEVEENWNGWKAEGLTDNAPQDIVEYAIQDIAELEYMTTQLRCGASMYQHLTTKNLKQKFLEEFLEVIVAQQWLGR